MRIFVFEHVCCGGMADDELPASLARQGGAMLRHLVADFLDAGHRVVTSLDARVSLDLGAAEVQRPQGCFEVFDRLARQADAAMVIAPEFDRLAQDWAARLRRLGVRSLGSPPEAIAQAADKLGLAEAFRDAGVPYPQTACGLPDRPLVGAIVIKPRVGADCEDTFVVRERDELAALPSRQDWIHQPVIPGLPASASFIVHDGSIRPLRGGQQLVRGGGLETRRGGEPGKPLPGKPLPSLFPLSYHGGRMPLPPRLEARALDLGRRALAALPRLRGFVGVDLVLGETPAGDRVIEVNPRPTVSYVGLRALCATNLAAALLDPAAPLAWRDGPLSFDGDGNTTWEESW